MTKVLVADDERDVRELLVDTLVDGGYEVIAASDGGSAFELASYENPDIILLDVWMPTMDGFEVLSRLKESPTTGDIPVIMLTAMAASKGEPPAIKLGVKHYITKPWEPGTVELAVKVALREGGNVTEGVTDGHASTAMRTGNMQLDQKMSGGIAHGSLTLVEGIPSAGKSVLCQHFTYEALLDGHGVAYFSSDLTSGGLVTQMGSLGRQVANHFREGKLGFYPVERPALVGHPERCEDPERSLALLALDIECLPSQYKVIIVDDITDLATHSRESSIMSFFSSCKYLCDYGRTIAVVARSYAFDERTLNRLQVVCDAHLNLRSEKIGAKMVKMLEVCKVGNAELTTGNLVSFEVVQGIGLRVVPGAKIRV